MGDGKTGTERANFCAVCEMGKNAFHGEFGISFKYKQDVLEVIGNRIGNTLLLGGIGFIIMFAGALLLGIPMRLVRKPAGRPDFM